MKDSLGNIRRGSGKSALACAQIAERAERAKQVDPATPPAGRTFGLCGAPDPATAGALKCAADFLERRGRATREGPRPTREVIRGIYRELHKEVVPLLRAVVSRIAADATGLPIPGTILAGGSAAPAGVAGSSTPPRDTPAPPPRRVEWGAAVKAYEALWRMRRDRPWHNSDLFDGIRLDAIREATRGRISPGGLSKLVSDFVRSGCAERPERGLFKLREPTEERRVALELKRRSG